MNRDHSRIRGILAFALLLGAGAACGDIDVSLTMEHSDTIQYEPVVGYLTIRNDTTEPIVIDEPGVERANTVVEFRVTRGGKPVPRLSDKPFVRRVILMPSDKHVVMLDVSQWFDMATMDRYLVAADVVRGEEVGQSNTRMVNVVRGLELARISRGVPGYPGRARTYSLRYWTREQKEVLFLSVEEESTGVNYGVFALGRIVRVHQPRIEVDRNGFVRVLHCTSFDRYARTVFESTADEVRFIDQSYTHTDGKPFR